MMKCIYIWVTFLNILIQIECKNQRNYKEVHVGKIQLA